MAIIILLSRLLFSFLSCSFRKTIFMQWFLASAVSAPCKDLHFPVCPSRALYFTRDSIHPAWENLVQAFKDAVHDFEVCKIIWCKSTSRNVDKSVWRHCGAIGIVHDFTPRTILITRTVVQIHPVCWSFQHNTDQKLHDFIWWFQSCQFNFKMFDATVK